MISRREKKVSYRSSLQKCGDKKVESCFTKVRYYSLGCTWYWYFPLFCRDLATAYDPFLSYLRAQDIQSQAALIFERYLGSSGASNMSIVLIHPVLVFTIPNTTVWYSGVFYPYTSITYAVKRSRH